MDAHEITTRLPPLREDEPASLRQDIVDEILDHLQCGLRRELLVQKGDETSAKERVLSRFGDPREVARKLWFQAMWSRIMSQRIVVGSALFSMVVCAALMGMMVWTMQQQQQANAALLEHIVKLIPQPVPITETPPHRGSGRSHLRVKVTLNNKEGSPAKGLFVSVTKQPELGGIAGMYSPLQFPVDQTGIADCGLTAPGRFEVLVRSPLNETARVMFTIPSEEDHLEHIVVPDKLPEMTKVVFRVGELPDELETNAIGLVMRLRPRSSRVFGDRSWAPNGRWLNVSTPLVLLSPSKGLLNCAEPESSGPVYPGSENWNVPIDEVIKHGEWESPHEWLLPAGEYSAQFGVANVGNDPTDYRWNNLDNTGRRCNAVWLRTTNRFTEEPGKRNEWMIQLPDYVSRCIRDPSKIPDSIDDNMYLNGQGDGAAGGFGGGGGGFGGAGSVGGGGFF